MQALCKARAKLPGAATLHIPGKASYTELRKYGEWCQCTRTWKHAHAISRNIFSPTTPPSAAAKQFGVSKSTVHKDLTERLEKIDPALYQQVRQLLDRNKAERHIRGGMATRRKYKGT
jgi:putative DeoR family transcriptional regulator (stage III sporulation protein D)